MCMLMFYVTEIDGVEGQWVAQLCGCKASSPLSACQKTEACQQLCVCVSPSVCVFVHYRVYICVQAQCANTGLCVCLTWGQPGPLPTAQREPSFPSMWHLLATGKYRTRWGRDWCMVATRCVCMFVCICMCHLCKDKSITHVQLHTVNLWMFKQTSVCACMHNSDEHVGSQRINRPLWYGTEKEREMEARGKPQAF